MKQKLGNEDSSKYWFSGEEGKTSKRTIDTNEGTKSNGQTEKERPVEFGRVLLEVSSKILKRIESSCFSIFANRTFYFYVFYHNC